MLLGFGQGTAPKCIPSCFYDIAVLQVALVMTVCSVDYPLIQIALWLNTEHWGS